jgi:uncharacterized protein YneF (UPF0154 family)
MLELNFGVGAFIGFLVIALIIGLVLGFLGARAFIKRQLKKNPPINEAQVRAMMSQMGRKPSEKQVRAVMRQIEENK